MVDPDILHNSELALDLFAVGIFYRHEDREVVVLFQLIVCVYRSSLYRGTENIVEYRHDLFRSRDYLKRSIGRT